MAELALLPEPEPEVNALAVGAAGEYRVASELLLRGLMPMIAAVDTGVDIVLQNGPTIQVKTNMRPRIQRGGARNYAFRFVTFSRVQGHRQRMLADYAVCWGVEDDAFWIIPASAIGDRSMIHIAVNPTPSRPGMWRPYRGAWESLR